MLYNKENIIGKTPKEIINLGISMSFIPEDRLGMGLIASVGMTDNMLLKTYKQGKLCFVDRKPAKALSKELIEKLEIKTPSTELPVRMLSGGNVQKVLLGREIHSEPMPSTSSIVEPVIIMPTCSFVTVFASQIPVILP